MHLVHEVTSPQAFDSLRISGRKVKYPELTLATVDHGVPTSNRALGIKDPLSKKQIDALEDNCKEFGVTIYGVNDPRQGIVHVIGPEQGITQPGMTIVCGDSHTATHGAFGALAFGIGTSEVEHVLATQTLAMNKPKTMKVEVVGEMNELWGQRYLIFGMSYLTFPILTWHFMNESMFTTKTLLCTFLAFVIVGIQFFWK